MSGSKAVGDPLDVLPCQLNISVDTLEEMKVGVPERWISKYIKGEVNLLDSCKLASKLSTFHSKPDDLLVHFDYFGISSIRVI